MIKEQLEEPEKVYTEEELKLIYKDRVVDFKELKNINEEMMLFDAKLFVVRTMIACGLTLDQMARVFGTSRQAVLQYKIKNHL